MIVAFVNNETFNCVNQHNKLNSIFLEFDLICLVSLEF